MTTPIIPPSIIQNTLPVREPELKDLLDFYQRQVFLNLNCHHIGTIQSFNPITQTVEVTINYKKTYFKSLPNSLQTVTELVDYPLIAECPVIILGGGSTYLNMPINPGDQCILLFNDRDIDNWYAGSTTSANQSSRLHSFGDAIALIGLNNLQKTVTGQPSTRITHFDSIRALITNGILKNGINPTNNKLTLQNNFDSLNTVLQDLCTQVEMLATATGNPTIAAAVVAIALRIGILIE